MTYEFNRFWVGSSYTEMDSVISAGKQGWAIVAAADGYVFMQREIKYHGTPVGEYLSVPK